MMILIVSINLSIILNQNQDFIKELLNNLIAFGKTMLTYINNNNILEVNLID